MVAELKSTVRCGAVCARGAPHGLGECGTGPGCDGRARPDGDAGRTDAKRPFCDAKRDGPF